MRSFITVCLALIVFHHLWRTYVWRLFAASSRLGNGIRQRIRDRRRTVIDRCLRPLCRVWWSLCCGLFVFSPLPILSVIVPSRSSDPPAFLPPPLPRTYKNREQSFYGISYLHLPSSNCALIPAFPWTVVIQITKFYSYIFLTFLAFPVHKLKHELALHDHLIPYFYFHKVSKYAGLADPLLLIWISSVHGSRVYVSRRCHECGMFVFGCLLLFVVPMRFSVICVECLTHSWLY